MLLAPVPLAWPVLVRKYRAEIWDGAFQRAFWQQVARGAQNVVAEAELGSRLKPAGEGFFCGPVSPG